MKTLLPLFLFAAACAGSGSRVPSSHRATAEACPAAPRPEGNCSPLGPVLSGICSSDAECTAGREGRCFAYHNAGCNCSYDTCNSDADCPANQLCACRGTFGIDPTLPNRCIAANCRMDADCGAHGYCAPSLDFTCGSYFGVTGFYCHTASDGCVDDSDCSSGSSVGVRPFCAFNPEVGHWACSSSFCAG